MEQISYFCEEHVWTAFVIGAASYFLGCVVTGYYLVRLRTGGDLRKLGSGSVGARNAGRSFGGWGFVLTFLGDFIKGAVAVGVTSFLFTDSEYVYLALVAVIAGHLWPVQLGFRGGKGVATSLGGLLFFGWLEILVFALFAVAYAVCRRTMSSGLIAFAFLPVVGLCLHRNLIYLLTLTVVATLLLFAHRANIASEIAHFRRGTPGQGQPRTNHL